MKLAFAFALAAVQSLVLAAVHGVAWCRRKVGVTA